MHSDTMPNLCGAAKSPDGWGCNMGVLPFFFEISSRLLPIAALSRGHGLICIGYDRENEAYRKHEQQKNFIKRLQAFCAPWAMAMSHIQFAMTCFAGKHSENDHIGSNLIDSI
ncbi:hypothetical protein [Azospirillum sp. SYSU D00513]|uniref:hypothetical protein n=1 Tax=Azospirillum sp. SYSU D00513 TaxID=2812561 RepID=UPI001A97B003|nr:hypothetical protein [Azospirillum sp. SYSU D00513]